MLDLCTSRPNPVKTLPSKHAAAQQFWVGKGEWQHLPVRDIAAAWRCSSSGLAAAAALAAPLAPTRDSDAALARAPYALQGARMIWCSRGQAARPCLALL